MRWTLIVSGDEQFQREAISGLRAARLVVGATGASAALGMVRGIDVERILVDGMDAVGTGFLATLRNLPTSAHADIEIFVVGGLDPTDRFVVTPSLERAIAQLDGCAA